MYICYYKSQYDTDLTGFLLKAGQGDLTSAGGGGGEGTQSDVEGDQTSGGDPGRTNLAGLLRKQGKAEADTEAQSQSPLNKTIQRNPRSLAKERTFVNTKRI